ncbi:hypothetical protein J7K24_01555, partial [bacterium]|nr:hypothetical protein [bacterium]
MKGVTFLEILIIVGIVAIIFVLTVPIGFRFYKSQYLYNTTEGIIQALRRARFQALSQSESNYGVFLGSGKSGRYILFRGNSYADREDEEIFEVPEDIFFSGISEVVFSKFDGLPSATGSIFITDGFATHTIDINQEGRITYVSSFSSGGCWGTGGSCDPACLYSNYGTLTDYYIDPGCSASCDPAGSF